MSEVCVAGGGYVGLVTAAGLARLGHRVRVVETNAARLLVLQAGGTPVAEPGLEGLVAEGVESGRLVFTGEYAEAVPDASFVLIAVNTPPGPSGETDLSFVRSAVASIAEYAPPGATLVMKSTAPPGTCDEIAEGLSARNVEVVSNPEFLRQSTAVADFFQPDRIVIGAEARYLALRVASLYEGIDTELVFTTRRSAELGKYAANAFLAARISLVNELAGICEAVGAEIDEVTGIVGGDARIGGGFLSAGLGWGGSCLPKDMSALAHIASSRSCRHGMLDAAFEVNVRQRQFAVDRLLGNSPVRPDTVVAVLGLAFKPGTDDVRGSPGLEVTARLLESGVSVRAHDPLAMANAAKALPNIAYRECPYETVAGAEAVLVATDWPEYRGLDWARVKRLMRGSRLVDGRNCLDAQALAELGFDYCGFGRVSYASAAGKYFSDRFVYRTGIGRG
jgi:UDPglucose 6-dehydrogenase